jgi:hypothetical protein
MKQTKMTVIVLALGAILLITACTPKEETPGVPSVPAGPTEGTTTGNYVFTTASTDPEADSIQIVMDWNDGFVDTTGLVASGTEVSLDHAWVQTGSFAIRALAIDKPENASAWSATHGIVITGTASDVPHTPAAPTGPTTGSKNTSYYFTGVTTDDDGDSVAYRFNFGSRGQPTDWTGYVASGSPDSMATSFKRIGTFDVEVQAKDIYGHKSLWSPALRITIN